MLRYQHNTAIDEYIFYIYLYLCAFHSLFYCFYTTDPECKWNGDVIYAWAGYNHAIER